jgi:CDGSH-type Zn-finger protein
MTRDHGDDWLKEESDESIRISQLEDRVTELETKLEKLLEKSTPIEEVEMELCVKCGCGRSNHPDPFCNANFQFTTLSKLKKEKGEQS